MASRFVINRLPTTYSVDTKVKVYGQIIGAIESEGHVVEHRPTLHSMNKQQEIELLANLLAWVATVRSINGLPIDGAFEYVADNNDGDAELYKKINFLVEGLLEVQA